MSGGGGTNTVVQASSIPPEYLAAYNQVQTQATNVAAQPLEFYSGNTVAGFTPAQTSAFNTVNNVQGAAQPYINAATGEIANSTAPILPQVPAVNATTIGNYESPYTADVVNATEAQYANTNAQQQNQLTAQAAAQGALGGDRLGVAQGILAGQQQATEAPVIAGLENQNYTQALGEANTQQQVGLNATEAQDWLASQGAAQLGNLGNESLTTGLTGASAQLQTGALEQQLAQEQLNVPYEEFLQQQAYPFQTTGWLAGISEGLGSSAGGNSTTTSPGPSAISQVAGLGLTGLGAYGALSNAGLLGTATTAAATAGAVDAAGSALPAYEGAAALSTIAARGGRIERDAGGGVSGFSAGSIPGVPNVDVSFIPTASGSPGMTKGQGAPHAPSPLQTPDPTQQGIGMLNAENTIGKMFAPKTGVSPTPQAGAQLAGMGGAPPPTSIAPAADFVPPSSVDDVGFSADALPPDQAARGGRIHFDEGGAVSGFGATPLGGAAPNQQAMMQQLMGMSAEQLQEYAARIPPSTPQGQMVQRVLQMKRMNPGAGQQGSGAPTPQAGSSQINPAGVAAATPGFADGGMPMMPMPGQPMPGAAMPMPGTPTMQMPMGAASPGTGMVPTAGMSPGTMLAMSGGGNGMPMPAVPAAKPGVLGVTGSARGGKIAPRAGFSDPDGYACGGVAMERRHGGRAGFDDGGDVDPFTTGFDEPLPDHGAPPIKGPGPSVLDVDPDDPSLTPAGSDALRNAQTEALVGQGVAPLLHDIGSGIGYVAGAVAAPFVNYYGTAQGSPLPPARTPPGPDLSGGALPGPDDVPLPDVKISPDEPIAGLGDGVPADVSAAHAASTATAHPPADWSDFTAAQAAGKTPFEIAASAYGRGAPLPNAGDDMPTGSKPPADTTTPLGRAAATGNAPGADTGVPVKGLSDDSHTPAAASSAPAAAPRAGFADSPWMALMAAGLGMMGGRSPHAGVNIGQGGLEGLKYLEQQTAQQDTRANRQATIDMEAKRLAETADFHKGSLDHEAAALAATKENNESNRLIEAQKEQDLAQHYRASDAAAAALKTRGYYEPMAPAIGKDGKPMVDENGATLGWWGDRYDMTQPPVLRPMDPNLVGRNGAGKQPAMQQSIQYMVQSGIAKDPTEAFTMLNTAKTNPEVRARLVQNEEANIAKSVGGLSMSLDEIHQRAQQNVDGMLNGVTGATGARPAPAQGAAPQQAAPVLPPRPANVPPTAQYSPSKGSWWWQGQGGQWQSAPGANP